MKQLRLKLVLGLIFLSLIPGRSYYYQLNLDKFQPIVRPVAYQLPSPLDYPVNVTGVPAPFLTSRAAVVIAVDSKTILYEKNPDLRLLPASLTKIMTALVALESYALGDVVTVGQIATEPFIMDLEPGEKITVENLLSGLLVGSANDSAIALAQAYPGGEAGFIKAMNQKAKELHLENTQFTNVIGFDDFGHYTTVHDLSLLTAEAMTNPTFKKIVSTVSLTVADVDRQIFHELENINELLGKTPGLVGVKTGRTELAGECLVTYTQRETKAIITIVLGSSDRFNDSRQLIDWAFINHHWL